MKKLHPLCFSKTSLFTLANFLSHRYQFVRIDENKSSVLQVTNGVPQGSILGPIIFNIYVHDIQYVDDTSIYRHSKPNAFESCMKEINSDVNEIESGHPKNRTWSSMRRKLNLCFLLLNRWQEDINLMLRSIPMTASWSSEFQRLNFLASPSLRI